MDGHAVVVGRLPVVALPAAPPSAPPTPPPVRSKRMRVARKFGQVLMNILFLGVVGCVLVMLGPAVLGFQRYVILTGSMTGTYDRGSVVYDRPVPTSSLKVGDPITYDPPPGFTGQTRVTHRIWSIHRGPDGQRIFKTKGDANQSPDVWTFLLTQPTQARVVFHIPEVGYVFLLLSLRNFRIALVGVPASIVGLFLLRRLWKEGGEEARRQRLAEQGWTAVTQSGSATVLKPIDAPAAVRLPARVDLRLRPVHARSVRKRPAARSRLDHSLPLRVGRLASTLNSGALADHRGSSAHQQPAPGASLATLRLLVARIDT
jgi:signal peptidase